MHLRSRFATCALAALLATAVGACGDDDPFGPITGEPGEATLTGDITGVRQLSADTTYTISGQLNVKSGGVLRIPAGTLLLGDAGVIRSFLLVEQGGQIFAEGTRDAPIVFTSSRPAGQRARGDWGGVVINGRSNCSFPAPCSGEGDTGEFGGNQPNDNSGVLRYVRIEYAGLEISADNELNGLTLNGVGSGTTIEFVQSHFGDDDGIEWFGGTVNVKYAVVTGAADDSFDFSTGWQGKGQFWIVQQDPTLGDRGFEVDGNERDFNATPLTSPLVFNVTLVGKGSGSTNTSVSPAGMQLRRGYAGKIRNAIVLGFESGLDIDNAETVARCQSGEMVVSNSIFFMNAAFLDPDSDTFEEACTAEPGWTGLQQVDPQLVAPFNRTNPDFRPQAGSPALTGFATPPSDGFFSPVSFIGAVAPSGTNSDWYLGWITTATS